MAEPLMPVVVGAEDEESGEGKPIPDSVVGEGDDRSGPEMRATVEQEGAIAPGYRIKQDEQEWIVVHEDGDAGLVRIFGVGAENNGISKTITRKDLEESTVIAQGTEQDAIDAQKQFIHETEKLFTKDDTTPEPVSSDVSNTEEPPVSGSQEGIEDTTVEKNGEDTPQTEPSVEHYSEAWVVQELSQYGVSAENLETLEGFSDLSLGQKAMLVENFKQSIIERTQDDAAAAFHEQRTKVLWPKRIWMDITKQYQLSKERKSQYAQLKQGGMEQHGGVLQALARGLKELGPEIEMVDGKLEAQFLNTKEIPEYASMTDREKSVIGEYNTAANAFARMPYAWSLETASRSEKKQYLEAKKSFIEARDVLRTINADRINVQQQDSLDVFGADERVRLHQLLNQHPDAEQAILDMSSEKSWKQALKSIATERGLYFAAGVGTRTAALGLLGAAALPAAAVGLGGVSAWRRTKQSLVEQDRLARKGVITNEDTARNVAKAKNVIKSDKAEIPAGLSDKLDTLMERIEAASEESDTQKKLLVSLQARIDFTKGKLEEGLVSFGSGSEAVAAKLALAESLAKAHMVAEIQRPDQTALKELQSSLDTYLTHRKETIDAKRARYMRKQVVKGAVLAGVFYGAGRGVRAVGDHFGWWDTMGNALDKATRSVKELTGDAYHSIAGSHAPVADVEIPSSPAPYTLPGKHEIQDLMREAEISPSGDKAEQLYTPADWRESLPETPPSDAHELIEKLGDTNRDMTFADWRQNLPEQPLGTDTAAATIAEQTPDAVANTVQVEIHKGEGMIKALARTLQEQYNLDPAKASEVANRLSAQDSDAMYSLVHAGDRFSIDLRGIDASELGLKTAKEIAAAADYDPKGFEATSGMKPGFLETTASAAEQTAPSPDHFAPLETGSEDVIVRDSETGRYLAEHHARFDPATRRLHFDLDGDGTISGKEIVVDLDEHLQQFDHSELSIDSKGNLQIDSFDTADNTKQSLVFSMEGDLVGGTSSPIEQPLVSETVAPQESAEAILSVEGRGAGRLAKRVAEMQRSVAGLEVSHPGLSQKLQGISALEAAGKKGALVKHLQEALALSKADATKLARPLHFVFDRVEEGFRKGGAPLDSDDTIGSVLKRLELKLKK